VGAAVVAGAVVAAGAGGGALRQACTASSSASAAVAARKTRKDLIIGNSRRIQLAASMRGKNDNTVGGHGDAHIDQLLLSITYVRAGVIRPT
jgi:hypothetical protein